LGDYQQLKQLHVACVALSLSLFFLRGLLVLRRSPSADFRWLAWSSHVIDSVLLGSALALIWMGGHQPLSDPWLRNKLIGVVVYIVLGALALKRAPTHALKTACFILALFVAGNLVHIALYKSPLGPLGIFLA
jgi:uncharacterized membrane protein SirB2